MSEIADFYIVHWLRSSLGSSGKPPYVEVVEGPYEYRVEAQIEARNRRESAYRSESWQRERGLYDGPYEDNIYRAMSSGELARFRDEGIDVR